MILLDTNVLSEVLRAAPDPQVMVWFARQPGATLFTSAVTRAELLYGVHLLPTGRRRDQLLEAVLRILRDGFAGRVLAFEDDAADEYAEIANSRRSEGRPISQFDGMLAGIARSRDATIATRNTNDFAGCGVEVVNPWLG